MNRPNPFPVGDPFLPLDPNYCIAMTAIYILTEYLLHMCYLTLLSARSVDYDNPNEFADGQALSGCGNFGFTSVKEVFLEFPATSPESHAFRAVSH